MRGPPPEACAARAHVVAVAPRRATVLTNHTVKGRRGRAHSAPRRLARRSEGGEPMESYKAQLRAFALGMSGKAKANAFSAEFVRGLLACFGWEETPGEVDRVIDLGGGETHKAGLWWPERKVLVEVRKPYVMLAMAWPEMLKICLGLDPMPRYVIFTNRRELHLYDTKRGRDEPLLNIEVEELPKYSEALAFLHEGWKPSEGIGPDCRRRDGLQGGRRARRRLLQKPRLGGRRAERRGRVYAAVHHGDVRRGHRALAGRRAHLEALRRPVRRDDDRRSP